MDRAPMTSVVVLLVSACLAVGEDRPAGTKKADQLQAAAIKHYLQKRYPHNATGRELLRFDPDASILELEISVLQKQAPHTRFYLTTLSTNLNEYPRVEVMVSACTGDGRVRMRECVSPVFTDVGKDFLKQFRGIKVTSEEDRQGLGEAIGMLFERVTPDGGLREGRLEGTCYRVELWSGDLYWRGLRWSSTTVGNWKVSGSRRQSAEGRIRASLGCHITIP